MKGLIKIMVRLYISVVKVLPLNLLNDIEILSNPHIYYKIRFEIGRRSQI